MKKYLPKEEGREGGEKSARAAHPPGPELEPRTCRFLGRGSQLHTMGVVLTSMSFVSIYRVGRLHNTMCCVFWR